MIFSKPCQYAILAMTYLAEQDAGRLRSIREIGEHVEAPLPFLSKVIGTLSRRGLVTARRGPNGGVMLSRPPSRTTVGDIVEAIDGPLDGGRCVLGFGECDAENPCSLHQSWEQVRAKLERTLHGKTLVDLNRAPTPPTRKTRAARSKKTSNAGSKAGAGG